MSQDRAAARERRRWTLRAIIGGEAVLAVFDLAEVVRGGAAVRVDASSALSYLAGRIALACLLAVPTFAFLACWRRTQRWQPAVLLAQLANVGGVAVVTLISDDAPRTVGSFVMTASATAVFLALLWAVVFLYPYTRAVAAEQRRRLAGEIDALTIRVCLEPHFLLNALHAVGGLVEQDPPRAQRLLEQLGDLLRPLAAIGTDGPLVRTLDEEVAWLERYAAIWQAWYGDRLTFVWEVTAAARERPIPTLLLQPLVENAILHGALRCGGRGVIRICGETEGPMLCCRVEDDGPGGVPSPPRDGLGLALVRRRLAAWGGRSAFELQADAGGGACARVRLEPAS